MSDKQQAKINVENTLLRIQLDIVKELRSWKQEFKDEIGKHVLHVLELHGQEQMLGAEPESDPEQSLPSSPVPERSKPTLGLKKRKTQPQDPFTNEEAEEIIEKLANGSKVAKKKIPGSVKLY